MGMGEPLNNYGAVVHAIALLVAPSRRGGFGLAPGHITVSTVGIIPRLRTLAADAPGVRLALSLHAPSQAEREALVPSASTFPLTRLLDAATAHAAAPGGSAPLIEYVLLRGVNDSARHADALGALLSGRGWSVNLIPFNRVPGAPYDPPAPSDVVAFQAALRTAHGINTTVRRTMGADIAGACGQLLVASQGGGKAGGGGEADCAPATPRPAAAVADIEDALPTLRV
jgi:adenine C2-methylase RlmN of 23S rRNA A2503 and tRNA A37